MPGSMQRRAVARGLAATLGLLAVSGCPISPEYKRPNVPLNASWSGDARLTKTAVDVAWWRSFKDPALDRLMEVAYQQNPTLQIAGLRILEARAQIGIATGQQWPSNPNAIAGVSLNGLNDHNVSAGNVDLIAGRYQVGFDALWEVDIWGKYRRGVKAAKAAYIATVADYDDALVSLSAEVARTYALIRTYQVLIQLARDNVAVQEEGQHIAEARFHNGATSELDVMQAIVQLESTRATIPDLQHSLTQAMNALCTLLGRTTGCAEPLLAGPGGIPTVPAQVAVSVPAELLRRRPDIRGAEMRAVAQCDRIGVAKTDLFPKLTLLGSVGTLTIQSTGAPSNLGGLLNLFNPGTLIYSLGASLFWPILSYPIILNNVRVQDAKLQQLLMDYVNTVLRAAQEVEDGISGYAREQEAAVFLQNAVTAAQQAVKLAVIQYREGAIDFQRVIDTQRSLLETENSLARTQSQVVTNLIALYKALGGGWEPRVDQPVVSDANRQEMQKRTNWGSYFSKPPPQPSQANGAPPTKR
jgi:NodT family efflux transporter outer membrane factor (OMF) lipoprotein